MDQRERPLSDGEAGTRRVGTFTLVPTLIRQLGVDPAPIVASARLDPRLLDHPANRVRYEALLRLLNGAAVARGCAHFGLLIGRASHLTDMGLLGELVRHAPTVGAGLRELVVRHHLNRDGALGFLLERADSVDFGYAACVPFAESLSQLYDGVLAAIVNFMRELCGDDWHPSAVFLPHSAPADVSPFRGHFRAPLHFDAGLCAVRFAASWLNRPIEGADAKRLRAAQALAQAEDRLGLVPQTQRAVRTLRLHGRSSGADVAQALALHRRTLDRRLRAEGTTFQNLLDQVRFAVAKELLEDSGAALPEIAAALGYADDVSFIRAFRRWTGATPGVWRESAWPLQARFAAPVPATAGA